VLTYLLVLVIVGGIVGALARLAVPGPNPMGCGATILVGIAGSMIAGVLARWLFNREAGLLLSVLCATLLVWLISRRDRQSLR
jgi:uncharacterized membrane protein YeaQ/YmgE (transglycosylase-associated protein family)